MPGASAPPPTVSSKPEPAASIPQPAASNPTLVFHYTHGERKLGQVGAAAIAASVAEDPGGKHRVWIAAFGKAWKNPCDVPEIAALIAAVGPPPDEEESLEPPPDIE